MASARLKHRGGYRYKVEFVKASGPVRGARVTATIQDDITDDRHTQPSIPVEEFMAKKKTKDPRARTRILPELLLDARQLKQLYFGASIDVPEGVRARAASFAKTFKLRKTGAAALEAALAEVYRDGYKKGEDKAAERAKESAHGTLRANERQMRRQQAAVAEAVKVLADVLRNNEVYGGATDSGVLTVSD